MRTKKGGIIIKIKSKKILLNMVLVIVLGIILSANNKVYARNNITHTQDRIKEIKIIEVININKLVRHKKNNIVNEENEKESITSRSGVNRNDNVINKTDKKYIDPKDVKISKNMDITKRTGMSKEDFKKVIKNLKQDRKKFFYENSDTIYDLCEKYKINEIFFCGLIVAESGWDIAYNHRSTHNYISLMYKGKLIRYSSTKEGLEIAAKKLHKNYLTPGGKFYNGKTINGVQKKFCPASSTWDDLVYGAMKCIASAI